MQNLTLLQRKMLVIHQQITNEITKTQRDDFVYTYQDQCNQTPMKSKLLCTYFFSPYANYDETEVPIHEYDICSAVSVLAIVKNRPAPVPKNLQKQVDQALEDWRASMIEKIVH